ncbi:serine/threonine-protein kinase [Haloechinothrix halophila]|uniref:serine/threonine-protein kinase n=1 Tax=Haloechinothrix halophila TaxID=1069073 RepID=UPI000A0264C8|nr:serine/threonine-protein kinase [Haloechinothrix halophila]
MADEQVADLTGRRLGNYRIDGVLGKGGMSVMYRATDVRLGRKVALKVIGEHLGADAEFRERFVDEARNTAAIDHPNIVPLYDFGELDGMHYIGMRLVDGSDLASLISEGPMRPERAVGLLEQVADALDTLHRRGLVHLDVKPANVLVTKRESIKEHVYVADFGLTRRGATGHRTRGGDFLGSPTYAAPEHLRGEPLDGRTDQYALACVLYACLTGRPPYPGDVQSVIKGHLNLAPPSAARIVSSLPQAIDAVLAKGMAKDPGRRYDSCVALLTAATEALTSSRARETEQRETPQRGAQQWGNGQPQQSPRPPHGPRAGAMPGRPPAQRGPGPVPPPGYGSPAPEPGPAARPAPAPPYQQQGRNSQPSWLVPLLLGAVVILVLLLAAVIIATA